MRDDIDLLDYPISIRANFISEYYSFLGFWKAVGDKLTLAEINPLWDDFLYFDSGTSFVSEHFEIWNRERNSYA